MGWKTKEQEREYFRKYRAKKRIPRLIEAEDKRKLLYKSLWSLSPVELSYIAGLLDGEGCITIVKGNHRRKGKNTSTEYALHVSLSNQHIPTLNYLKSVTGLGSVSCSRGYDYKWCLSSQQALEVLKYLTPYLKIKLKQTGVAIQFQSNLSVWSHYKLSDSQKQEREALKSEIMRLNHLRFIQPDTIA